MPARLVFRYRRKIVSYTRSPAGPDVDIFSFYTITSLSMAFGMYMDAKIVAGMYEDALSEGTFEKGKGSILLEYFGKEVDMGTAEKLVRAAHKAMSEAD